MNKKVWSDLKSRRAVIHRSARKRKRAGELQHKREMPDRLKGLALAQRPLPTPAAPEKEKPKIAEKTGMIKRLYRRVTGV